jgi:hypothetical protein
VTELTGPSTYRLPKPLTWKALWAVVAYLFTGDAKRLTAADWVEIVHVECEGMF